MHPAVRVEDLGKCYQIDETQPRGGYNSLREDLMNLVKAPLRRFHKGAGSRRADFWALKGVGFELKPGEVLGVVRPMRLRQTPAP